ncbi:MAG: Fe2+-dependent dioxygenase [Lautropia sp.]
MLITIEGVLDAHEAGEFRTRLDAAAWEDGARTAGNLATQVKHNQQLPASSALAAALGNRLLQRLERLPLFTSAALPRRIHPPRFNRYADRGHYGAHVDGAVMMLPGTGGALRTDLSATLFLSDPDTYEGGELEIEGAFGAQAVKLPAGDMVLYPASSLHRVTPVERGVRLASFFWIESLVPLDADRTLLFDLDQAIQSLTPRLGTDSAELLKLTGIYHNLLRRWACT